MQEIHVQDKVMCEFEEIKSEASRHFSNIYIEKAGLIADGEIMDLIPKLIRRKDNERLVKSIMI